MTAAVVLGLLLISAGVIAAIVRPMIRHVRDERRQWREIHAAHVSELIRSRTQDREAEDRARLERYLERLRSYMRSTERSDRA